MSDSKNNMAKIRQKSFDESIDKLKDVKLKNSSLDNKEFLESDIEFTAGNFCKTLFSDSRKEKS